MVADISSPATPGAQRMMAPAVARLAGVASSARDRSRAAVPAASGCGRSSGRPSSQPWPNGTPDRCSQSSSSSRSTPSATSVACSRSAMLHNDSTTAALTGVGVAVVGERPVELHDVGPERRELRSPE